MGVIVSSRQDQFTMNKLALMSFAILSLFAILIGHSHAADAPPRPNIVILFADDAGYADFGFQPDVRPDMAHLTPHIDSIAARGACCSSAYVTGAVCSPSRSTLITPLAPM